MSQWLVVGLGNPGPRYERTRHNVGFRALDELVRRHNLPAWKGGKFGADTTSGVVVTPRGRERCVLCKPMEFMNLSGFAVQRVAKFHDIPIDHIVVAHDEIDLDHGMVRVKTGGGHGGHNGLRSMIDQLGGNGFVRLRIGVGKPGPGAGSADGGAAAARAAGNQAAAAGAAGKDVAGWVLADFPAAQAASVDAMLGRAADALESVLGLGAGPTMNAFNALPRL